MHVRPLACVAFAIWPTHRRQPQDNGQPSVVGRLPACWEWWNHRAVNLRNPAGLLLNLRNGQFGTGKHDKTISPFAARTADLVSRE